MSARPPHPEELQSIQILAGWTKDDMHPVDQKARVEESGLMAIHHGRTWPGFTVTHVPTGLALAYEFPTTEAAAAFVAEALTLADWRFTDHDGGRRMSMDVSLKVRALAIRLGGNCGGDGKTTA